MSKTTTQDLIGEFKTSLKRIINEVLESIPIDLYKRPNATGYLIK